MSVASKDASCPFGFVGTRPCNKLKCWDVSELGLVVAIVEAVWKVLLLPLLLLLLLLIYNMENP